MTDKQAAYLAAIRALNNAAYAAVKAAKDTTEMPMVNRQALRKIAAMSDRLVDAGLEAKP